MTDLMEAAIESLQKVAPSDREAVARAVLQLVGEPEAGIELSPDDRLANDEAEAEFSRGEVASDAEVRAVWAKHGL